jgi:two-component system, cell cycle sensor histidine kinase and response regulator CckA
MTQAICDDKDIVLVVDDEEMIEEMIQKQLERRGCLTVSFNNSREALEYYIANVPKITLIITDLTMPLVSGPELIKNALRINPKVPIILVTGYADEQIPDDIRPFVQHVLPKPFLKSELLHAVRTALDKVDHQHLPA